MDKRNSKESLLNRIHELESRLEKVYDAGIWGIAHVSLANYRHRQVEAENKLNDAMYPHENREA